MNGIILAHGAAQSIFDLHLSNWSEIFDELCVICPSDDVVLYDGELHSLGLSEHHGYWNCERMRYACELAAMKKSACILEYDTLVYDMPLPNTTLQGCGPMYDYRPHYASKWFMHSPWIMSSDNFGKVAEYAVVQGRHEYCDRWLAEACDALGIAPSALPCFYTPPCGFIRNSEEWRNAVNRAHSSNLSAIHGIKEEILSKTIYAIRKI